MAGCLRPASSRGGWTEPHKSTSTSRRPRVCEDPGLRRWRAVMAICVKQRSARPARRLSLCRIESREFSGPVDQNGTRGGGSDPSSQGCSVVANAPKMRCRVGLPCGRQWQCLRCRRCKVQDARCKMQGDQLPNQIGGLGKCCWPLARLCQSCTNAEGIMRDAARCIFHGKMDRNLEARVEAKDGSAAPLPCFRCLGLFQGASFVGGLG